MYAERMQWRFEAALNARTFADAALYCNAQLALQLAPAWHGA